MRETLDYPVGRSTLRLVYGSILRLDVDVLVSPDDVNLSMGDGVSHVLMRAGGERVHNAARQAGPIGLGEIAATTGGRLKARKIFHAAVMDYSQPVPTTGEVVRAVTSRCLAMCDKLRCTSIAFPALAMGVGGLSPEESARAR